MTTIAFMEWLELREKITRLEIDCARIEGLRRRAVELSSRLIDENTELRAALKEFTACDLTPIVRFFNAHGEAAPSAVFYAQEIARGAMK